MLYEVITRVEYDVEAASDRIIDAGLRDPLAQGLPLHVRHDVVQEVVRLAGVVQRKDVRVLESYNFV